MAVCSASVELGTAQRPLLVELLAHHLGNDGWDGDVHHPYVVTDADLNAHRNDGFAGRQHTEKLGLGFDRMNRELDGSHRLPGLFQVVQNDAEQAIEQFLFNFGDLPA